MATVASIAAEIASERNDASYADFTLDEYQEFVKRAIRELSELAPKYKVDTLNLVAGTLRYSFPNDCKRPISLRDATNSTVEAPDWITFEIKGREIELVCDTDSSISGELYYAATYDVTASPLDLTDVNLDIVRELARAQVYDILADTSATGDAIKAGRVTVTPGKGQNKYEALAKSARRSALDRLKTPFVGWDRAGDVPHEHRFDL